MVTGSVVTKYFSVQCLLTWQTHVSEDGGVSRDDDSVTPPETGPSPLVSTIVRINIVSDSAGSNHNTNNNNNRVNINILSRAGL